jgi:hypothetical protein
MIETEDEFLDFDRVGEQSQSCCEELVANRVELCHHIIYTRYPEVGTYHER